MVYILFVIGFILLVKGADWLVEGSSSLAKRMKVSPMVVGLTLVALGTSVPELVVNVLAAVQWVGDIALGNIIGSNIANILLVLGATSVILPLAINRKTRVTDIPLALLIIVGLALLTYDGMITRMDAGVLILFLIIFIYYIFTAGKIETDEQPTLPKWKMALYIFLGILLLMLGGKWVVEGAVAVARFIGITERVIGLTVVAIGTSLPELVTSVVAAWKGNNNIAIGNIVGSNVLNIVLVLATTAFILPLQVSSQWRIDIIIGVGVTALFLLAFIVGKKEVLQRWQGALFLLLYVVYVLYTLGVRSF